MSRFFGVTLLFLALVLALGAFLWSGLGPVFVANVPLNLTIVGVFVLGMGYGVWQIRQVVRATFVLDDWTGDVSGFLRAVSTLDRSSAPVVDLILQEMGGVHRWSPRLADPLREKIEGFLDGQRAMLRYLMGGLVFLGLLGTFWGLSLTIHAIAQVISHLPTQEAVTSHFFESFKDNLKSPLQGMGTAFGSSLFGIAGSLILGFVDLQLGRASRALNGVFEGWVEALRPFRGEKFREESAVHELTGPLRDDGKAMAPLMPSDDYSDAYLDAIWGHVAEHLDRLQRTIQGSERGRVEVTESLASLTLQLSRLTDQMRAEQSLMLKLAEGQIDVGLQLKMLVRELQEGAGQVELRGQLSNLDHVMQQVVKAMREGHQETLEGFRQELRILGRTLSNALDYTPPPLQGRGP